MDPEVINTYVSSKELPNVHIVQLSTVSHIFFRNCPMQEIFNFYKYHFCQKNIAGLSII